MRSVSATTTIPIPSGSDRQLIVFVGIKYMESSHKIIRDGQDYAIYPNQTYPIEYPLWYIYSDTFAYLVTGVFDGGSYGIGIIYSKEATVEKYADGYNQANSPSIVKVHLHEPSSEDNHKNFFKFPLVL